MTLPNVIVPLPVCYAAFVLAILFGVWLARRAVAWVNGGKDA